MSIIIIIPARKSSKRLKNKNILKINRKSLIDITLNFSKKIKFAQKIILSTDISKKKIKLNDDRILYIKRPKNLATDNSKIYKTILNIEKYLKKNTNIKFDSVLLLQPTSPFRSMKTILKAYSIFNKNNKIYSVVSFKEGYSLKKKFFLLIKIKELFYRMIK